LAGDGRKIFVALTSTTQDHVERAYEALADRDVSVVMATTPELDRSRLTGATNILVEGLLPSHLIMPRCDLAIIHGGQGSVQTAIASGTPIIGVPLQPEQAFNLRLVQQHGAGRCLSLRALSRGRLGQAVDELLDDGAFAVAMEKLQRAQATRDGPLAAAQAICDLARTWNRDAGPYA
jgi:UDP:flavonoid glycosyltransferase YjiC (YdhE family)